MMEKCPACGSTEVIPDLIAFTGDRNVNHLFVNLVPQKGQRGDDVSIGFRIDVCGICGHAELHTKYPNDLLEAYKKGYKTDSD
jgi:hypothetical protein